MISKILDMQQLKALCGVIAETKTGLTKSKLEDLLRQSNIKVLSDGSSRNQYGFSPGLNKRDWLYNCLANDINQNHNLHNVYVLIERALNPVDYTSETKREFYNTLLCETNKVLLLAGLHVTRSGKIEEVNAAANLDEVDRRVDSLQQKLYQRSIHPEVVKYCKKELLQKDYFDIVFESAKGLAQRVRDITGLTNDGGELFQTAFSLKNPWIIFNSLTTESEKSEYKGLKELLEAIFHLARNPAAHTPKINWRVDENKALDILTLISFAHKYLDECYKMPGKP